MNQEQLKSVMMSNQFLMEAINKEREHQQIIRRVLTNRVCTCGSGVHWADCIQLSEECG